MKLGVGGGSGLINGTMGGQRVPEVPYKVQSDSGKLDWGKRPNMG